VHWAFDGGQLRLLANFGTVPAETGIADAERVIWRSPNADMISTHLRLPAWSSAVLTTRTAESRA
jgi:hypothetical protein